MNRPPDGRGEKLPCCPAVFAKESESRRPRRAKPRQKAPPRPRRASPLPFAKVQTYRIKSQNVHWHTSPNCAIVISYIQDENGHPSALLPLHADTPQRSRAYVPWAFRNVRAPCLPARTNQGRTEYKRENTSLVSDPQNPNRVPRTCEHASKKQKKTEKGKRRTHCGQIR